MWRACDRVGGLRGEGEQEGDDGGGGTCDSAAAGHLFVVDQFRSQWGVLRYRGGFCLLLLFSLLMRDD
jgi:hypothetical protein